MSQKFLLKYEVAVCLSKIKWLVTWFASLLVEADLISV
jgi:hypothetical protein